MFCFLSTLGSSQKIQGDVIQAIYLGKTNPVENIEENGISYYQSLKESDRKAAKEMYNPFDYKEDFPYKVIPEDTLGDPLVGNGHERNTPTDFDLILNYTVEGTHQNNSRVTPSDCNGDAGRDYFIHTTNYAGGAIFIIYDRYGNKLTDDLPISSLWSELRVSGNGDPIVLYDQEEDRWIISEFGAVSGQLLIGISSTSNPFDDWQAWLIKSPELPDYPKYGIWNNHYVLTTSEFTIREDGTFGGQRYDGVYAIDRKAMLRGESVLGVVKFNVPNISAPSNHTFSPVDWQGNIPPPENDPPLVMRIADNSWPGIFQDQIEMREIHVDWSAPQNSFLSDPILINPSAFNLNICNGSRQCATQPLGKFDGRPGSLMYKIHYRNFGTHESMVMNHAVNIDNDEHIGIRWYEMRRTGNADWNIYQEGTYAPTSDVGRFCGSIGIDELGNIALGYTVSGPSKFPSTRITGRRVDDPLGEMTATEVEVETGNDNVSPTFRRWGDYFSLSVHPEDGKNFILVHQVQTDNLGWQSFNTSFHIEKDEIDIQPIIINDQYTFTEPYPPFSARIFNNGTASVENYEIGYTINGSDIVWESLDSTIAPNTFFDYEFQNQPNFDNSGEYTITTITKLMDDQNINNDTATIQTTKPFPLDAAVLPINGLAGNPCRTGGLLRLQYQNNGLDTIRNLKLGYFLNNDNPIILESTSLTPPGRISTRTQALRNLRRGLNTLTFYSFDPNGEEDSQLNNDTIRESFYANFERENFTLEFLSDNFPQENRWEIVDQNGTLVDEGNISNGLTSTTICLDPSYCYTFKLFDLAGDGIVGNAEPGSWELLNGDGEIVISNIRPDFGFEESIDFCASNECIFESITYISPESSTGNNDGTILIEPLGGLAPFTYQINNNPPDEISLFNGLNGGNYTFIITDARDCKDTIDVILPSCELFIETVIVNESAPGANDGSISLLTQNANGLIEYSLDGVIFIQDTVIPTLSDGDYNITIRDEVGCFRELSVSLDGTVSTQNLSFGNEIMIYPNPSTGIFKVEIKGEHRPLHPIQIYDVNGKLVYENWLPQINGAYHSGIMTMSGIRSGLYFLKTKIKGKYHLKKIIVTK